jgi:hypothetical protein
MALSSSLAMASPDSAALQSLGRINSYTPLEAAHSHGEIGFSFGLGIQPRLFDRPNLKDITSHYGDSEKYDRTLVNAYLVKGFRWPIDFGVSTGQIPGSSVKRLGAHLQWTAFEGFRLPSLATRLAFSRLSGYAKTELASSEASLLADYAIFSYLTFYVGVSTLFHHASYHPDMSSLAMQNEFSRPPRQTRQWWSRRRFSGLVIQLLPPYFKVTAEYQRYEEDRENWMGKLSFGL